MILAEPSKWMGQGIANFVTSQTSAGFVKVSVLLFSAFQINCLAISTHFSTISYFF